MARLVLSLAALFAAGWSWGCSPLGGWGRSGSVAGAGAGDSGSRLGALFDSEARRAGYSASGSASEAEGLGAAPFPGAVGGEREASRRGNAGAGPVPGMGVPFPIGGGGEPDGGIASGLAPGRPRRDDALRRTSAEVRGGEGDGTRGAGAGSTSGSGSKPGAGGGDPSALRAPGGLDGAGGGGGVGGVTPRAFLVAARVGETVITMREVERAIPEFLRKRGIPAEAVSAADRARLEGVVLGELVDRTLVLREAKRTFGKKPEAWGKLEEYADKEWERNELPGLLRERGASDVEDLREAMAREGIDLDELRKEYRATTIFNEFVRMRVGPELRVDLPEMIAHYEERKEDYGRRAGVTWREIVVDVSRCASRDEAREKAEALWRRVAAGEDFEALARAESHGPTAREGGLWEDTSPGSHAEAEVNRALATLAPGEARLVLGGDGFHIVRVEGRRSAGPRPFGEVQAEIRDRLFQDRARERISAYILGLRERTPIVVYGEAVGNPELDRALRAPEDGDGGGED